MYSIKTESTNNHYFITEIIGGIVQSKKLRTVQLHKLFRSMSYLCMANLPERLNKMFHLLIKNKFSTIHTQDFNNT
jgi:hypothetical protein